LPKKLLLYSKKNKTTWLMSMSKELHESFSEKIFSAIKEKKKLW